MIGANLGYSSFYAQGINLPQYPPYIVNAGATKVSGDGSFDYITYGYLSTRTIDFGNLFGVTGGFVLITTLILVTRKSRSHSEGELLISVFLNC